MEPDDIFERTAARVARATLLAAMIGTIVAMVWKGLLAGGSFALGAFASWLNLRWITGFVGSLGPKPKRVATPMFAIRYVLFAIGGYVIVKYTRINLPAALTGLFVSLAGAIFEIITQLTYGRDLGNKNLQR